MLTVLLGPIMALHLMTYQAGEQMFSQTLVTDDIKVCHVHWEMKGELSNSENT